MLCGAVWAGGRLVNGQKKFFGGPNCDRRLLALVFIPAAAS